ncbi:MAG: tetratricopeptide repeat protein, partial [Arenimonas sp.]|nr:tetratricopeptide repeat protein [Arenimonas sp.]
GLVVKLRQGLGDDRQALDLLDRQSQVLASLEGEAPARIGIESAALRGRSLRALGQPEVCVRALVPWMPVSEQQAANQPRAVSEFLSQLGRCHRALGGRDVARDLFGQALALRRAPGESKALQAESLADLAGLLADEGRYAEAITATRAALGLLRQSGGDRNALGVEIWRELGGLYRSVGDALESEASYRQALEIALTRFGPGHPATTAVQRPLGAILLQAGELEEAQRLLQAAHDRLLARFGPEHPDVAASWQQLGRLAWEQGRLALAREAFERSLQLRRRSNELGARGGVVCDLAMVRLAIDGTDSAELLAHECQQLALGSDPELAARAEMLLADVALRRDNPDAALALLASARQRLLAAGLAPDALALEPVNLARARIAVDHGDATTAATLVQALQAQPREPGPESQAWAWRSKALEARRLCLSGAVSQGRELRARALAQAGAEQPERQRLLDDIAALGSPCGVP